MTNSDRIRQMTDKQLAEFLASLMPQSCDSCRLQDPDLIPMFHCRVDCEKAWTDWLKDYDRHFWKGKEPLKDDGNNSEGRTMDGHSKRFQAIAEQVYESFRNNMEKTAYDWLISRGWDGKDIEEATELAKGYEIVRYPDLSCEVRRIAENATEATEQEALYCLHCPLHVDCDKTQCPYYSNTALAMMSGGIGHIRTSRPLKEVIKDSEEKTRRLINPKRG